jgi:hypothetical protein
VNAGNDSTFLLWSTDLCNSNSQATATLDKAADSSSSSCGSTAAPGSTSLMTHQAVRPAEDLRSGMLKTTFNIDWHEVDLFRGPGSILRGPENTFTFIRHQLPQETAAAISSLTASSNSNVRQATSEDCSPTSQQQQQQVGAAAMDLQVFRVDLQYVMPGAAQSAAVFGQPPSTSSSTSSTDMDISSDSDSLDGSSTSSTRHLRGNRPRRPTGSVDNIPDWALRAAQEVLQLYASNHQEQYQQAAQGSVGLNSSSSSSSNDMAQSLASLLVAAADGTAPAASIVSEQQQPVRVAGVDLQQQLSAGGGGDEIAMHFKKVVGQQTVLAFGGWQVTGKLAD